LEDGCCDLPKGKQQVDDVSQFIHVDNRHLHQHVFFAGHPMTVHHLRSSLGQLDNRTDLARSWPNADVRR
jgi:hypothetical protein